MGRLAPKLLICGITLLMAVFSHCSIGEEGISSLMSDQFRSMVEGREKRSADPWDNSELKISKGFPWKSNLQITGFSEEEKRNLVHIHNAYRSLVRRPLAANMREVTWDDEIGAFAQAWANKCTGTHQGNRNLGPWVNMGENLYWIYSGSYNEARGPKWWWDEVRDYNFRYDTCKPHKPGAVCGHYVTLAWAPTAKIGCGIARCPRILDLPDYGRGAYYFVCNYSGTFYSWTRPYQGTDLPGSTCYRYPDAKKTRYNLCVSQYNIDHNIGYNGSTEITGLERTVTRSDPRRPIITTTATTTTTANPNITVTGTNINEAPKPSSGKRYRCPLIKRCPQLFECFKKNSRRQCRRKISCPKWCYRKE